ncbi:MAG: hypothetical protein CM15mP58_23240 [Burkholderiaceae bacterium]|nr:MAG: hypothetical protein CM15mP58_23240 [Burkholderiaceae bacterium]
MQVISPTTRTGIDIGPSSKEFDELPVCYFCDQEDSEVRLLYTTPPSAVPTAPCIIGFLEMI